MTFDADLQSIRRWLMVVSLLLAIQIYFTSATTTGVYLNNVISLLVVGAIAVICILLAISFAGEVSDFEELQ